MLEGLKGHQLSGTRRLNGHYQSARRGPKYSYTLVYYPVYERNTSTDFISLPKFNPYKDRLKITVEPTNINIRNYPATLYGSGWPRLNYLYEGRNQAGFTTRADLFNTNFPNDSLTMTGGPDNASYNLPTSINVTTAYTVKSNNGRELLITSGDANANIDFEGSMGSLSFLWGFAFEIDPADVPPVSQVLNYPINVTFELL